jgi:glutamate synthase (NADPH/NADH) large chain
MTGGFAFVLDTEDSFHHRINNDVDIHSMQTEAMDAHRHYLMTMIQEHQAVTGSEWGAEIVENFDHWVDHFWLVKPKASEIDSLIETLRDAA